MNVQKFVEYRRAELAAEHERRQVNAAGIGTSALMRFAERAKIIETVLAELERLAEWEAGGEPEFTPPIDEAERAFWLKARDRGIKIPREIEAQL